MSKLVIIGIDGLDPYLIERWIDDLPYLKSIKRDGLFCKIESTFPPDSICAWSSIFTGQNPAQHGLLESIDYLSSKKYQYSKGHSFDNTTFWDAAGSLGKKVCVINPFLAYPAHKVNGYMVSGPIFEGGMNTFYPPELKEAFDFPELGGWVDSPREKDFNSFLEKVRTNTRSLAKSGLDIYNKTSPDLFFITFLTLDRVQHFFWRFMNSNITLESEYKNTIKEFYCSFDNIIGDFVKNLAKGERLLIISDHGHKERGRELFNLNEYFRRRNYLYTKDRTLVGKGKKIFEKIKGKAIINLNKFGLQRLMYGIAKIIPNARSLKKAYYMIDNDKTLARVWNLSGTSPYSGVELIKGPYYEQLRNQIILELEGLNNRLSRSLVKWVKKREDLYVGQHLDKYPDIILELNENYGIGWNLFGGLIEDNYDYKRISGSHREEAVLNIYPKFNLNPTMIPTSIIGLKNFIIYLLTHENTFC